MEPNIDILESLIILMITSHKHSPSSWTGGIHQNETNNLWQFCAIKRMCSCELEHWYKQTSEKALRIISFRKRIWKKVLSWGPLSTNYFFIHSYSGFNSDTWSVVHLLLTKSYCMRMMATDSHWSFNTNTNLYCSLWAVDFMLKDLKRLLLLVRFVPGWV